MVGAVGGRLRERGRRALWWAQWGAVKREGAESTVVGAGGRRLRERGWRALWWAQDHVVSKINYKKLPRRVRFSD